MKKALVVVGITAALSACNSDNTNADTAANTSADTSNYSAQVDPAGGTGTMTPDSAAMGGQSLMSIMQQNMNQMKSMQSAGSADKDFASMMKTHHMGATQMAQLEVAQGQDQQLKQMAQQMIDEQQKETAEFDAFLSNTSAQANTNTQGSGDAFHKKTIDHMNSMKMDMDHSGSMDQQFARMMIPHHQHGIDMAKTYLQSGARDEKLKTLANKIIADQQKEINDLQAWLTKNK